jgi:hypothetical protein
MYVEYTYFFSVDRVLSLILSLDNIYHPMLLIVDGDTFYF